ncbi:hypothetical protein BKA69DRAFT_1081344 [Paraphysoderma sedebokerense]|nr:hypothetical protein BKA69DRAFT_1081344 [Paraphysoderma sedebokerense]
MYMSHPVQEISAVPWRTLISPLLSIEESSDVLEPQLYVKSQFSATQKRYVIVITDLKDVWWDCADEKKIMELKSKYIPNLQAGFEEILDALQTTIESKEEGIQYRLRRSKNEQLYLSVTLPLSSIISFSWTFTLTALPLSNVDDVVPTATDVILSNFITPLMAAHYESKQLVTKLIDMMKHKDAEIAHMLRGMENIPKRIPKPFNEEEFTNEVKSSRTLIAKTLPMSEFSSCMVASNSTFQEFYKPVVQRLSRVADERLKEKQAKLVEAKKVSSQHASRSTAPSVVITPESSTSFVSDPKKESPEEERKRRLEEDLARQKEVMIAKKKRKKF